MSFGGGVRYYATALHELCHWTSHPSRCKRELGKRFGDGAYAAEELIAEIIHLGETPGKANPGVADLLQVSRDDLRPA